MAKTTKKASITTKKETAKSAKVQKGNRLSIKDFFLKYKKVLILGGALIVVAALAFLGKGLFIAAAVNGQPISRLKIVSDIEKRLGQETLEREISKTLVYQEAAKKNINISDKELDGEINKFASQLKAQGQDLNQLLMAQGITQEQFRDDMKFQVVVKKILGDKTKVTDKEIDDFIKQNQSMLNPEDDAAKTKENVKAELESQKLNQEYQKWIAEVRKNANVLQFVDYKSANQ